MADITVTDLTNENGNGVFDKLVSAMQIILVKEFKDNRITGTEYSKIFMSSLDSAMNQSMQFLLQKDQAAKQVEVLEAQRLLTLAQKDIAETQLLIAGQELLKVTAEVAMMPAQQELLEAQVLLTEAQAAKVTVEVEILEIEKTKTAAEVLLIEAQTDQAIKQVEVLTAQILNLPKEGVLLDKQAAKTDAETLFLDQRIKTEKSQIVDTIDGVAVFGTVKKQKDLYDAQAKGFTTDAEYKVMKALIETWITRRGTDEGTAANDTNNLDDDYIGAAVAKCFTSVGITLP